MTCHPGVAHVKTVDLLWCGELPVVAKVSVAMRWVVEGIGEKLGVTMIMMMTGKAVAVVAIQKKITTAGVEADSEIMEADSEMISIMTAEAEGDAECVHLRQTKTSSIAVAYGWVECPRMSPRMRSSEHFPGMAQFRKLSFAIQMSTRLASCSLRRQLMLSRQSGS
jgi:hypothetical protein